MLCPICSNKMTVLLYDVVCDNCNPPGTSYLGKNKTNPNNSKYYYGYITCSDPNEYLSGKYVYKNIEKAKERACFSNRPFVVKVASKFKLLYKDGDGDDEFSCYDYIPQSSSVKIDDPDYSEQVFFQEIAFRY